MSSNRPDSKLFADISENLARIASREYLNDSDLRDLVAQTQADLYLLSLRTKNKQFLELLGSEHAQMMLPANGGFFRRFVELIILPEWKKYVANTK